MRDPYSVLGVPPGCSDRTLKKAMRELSKRWHPDMNPGREQMAEIRFREIQEAYEQILEERRSGRIETYADPSPAKKRTWAKPGSKGASHIDPNDTSSFRWETESTWENTGFTYQRTEPKPEEENVELMVVYRKADELILKGLEDEAYWELKKIPEAKQDTPLWNYYMARVFKKGDPFYAYEYIIKAVNSEPEDERFQKLFEELDTEENRKAMKRKNIKKIFSNEFFGESGAIMGTGLAFAMVGFKGVNESRYKNNSSEGLGTAFIVIGVSIMIIGVVAFIYKSVKTIRENSDIL